MTLTKLEQTKMQLEETGSKFMGITETPLTKDAKKKRYWTPDGREVWAVPTIRGWQKTRVINGRKEVIETGTRDANYDKGWLSEPPEKPKIYCGGCDKWHDTKEQVNKCIKTREALIKQHTPKEKEPDVEQRVDNLEKTMNKILSILEEKL